MPALSHITELYQVKDCRVAQLTSDPNPTQQNVSGATNTGTAVTLTVPDGTVYAIGDTIVVSGITGFTTNNPNGTFVVTGQAATTVTYTAASAPTGTYGSGGIVAGRKAPAYAGSIQVPGIKTLVMTPGFTTKELRGAGQQLDVQSKMTTYKFTFDFAQLGLDALAMMQGDAVVDTGTTPNRVASLAHVETGAVLPKWKIEGMTDGVDVIGGDEHFAIYRCVLDAESLGFADEDFHIMKFGGSAARRHSDQKTWEIFLNETSVAIG